ncbi:MAG TPA: orotate phosphoribosyltransferase [Firmicutes bacterium]|nr:orotate phosphoribosyltransferase [Bacillota bacterium]
MNETKRLLEEVGAILTGHFQLTSGRHSDTYIQCARVLENPLTTEKLVSKWVDMLQDLPCDLVIGPAVGGIILSYELGKQLGKKAIFAERQEGQLTLRRSFEIEPHHRVVVVEDVVTTGGSVLETIDLVEKNGGEVIAVCSLVDRGSDFEPGIPYYPLLKVQVDSYSPENCVLCKEGKPIDVPGSRKLK